jgi:adenylosuccinate synthase
VITKLDVLAGIDPIRVAVRYRSSEGAVLTEFPYHQTVLHGSSPEYEELPGFTEDIGECRTDDDLPQAAIDYIRFIEDFVGVPVNFVGVGPGREQMVSREPS